MQTHLALTPTILFDMATKICVVCGSPFKAAPSDKTVTCSPACRSVRASLAAKNSDRKWSDAAKLRRAKDPSVRQQMANLQRVGLASAMEKPEGQRGPQNRESKIWTLITPDGELIKVRNLKDWSRKNYTLFEPQCDNIDAAANRVARGFMAIASSKRGVKSRKRAVNSYKGWGLYCLPEMDDKEGK